MGVGDEVDEKRVLVKNDIVEGVFGFERAFRRLKFGKEVPF